jgi:hypothetical protein
MMWLIMVISVLEAMGKKDISHVEATIQHEKAGCGGSHTALSKDCGKRANEVKINRLMATKNIISKKKEENH